MIRRPIAVALLALALVTSVSLSMSRSVGFPHEQHVGLFPTCLGCHGGIPDGDEDRYYSVEERDCVRCHDGTREDEVEWRTPAPTPSNVLFSHLEHIEEVASADDPALGCADCHGPLETGQARMEIGRAQPATCVGCHAHEATEHLGAEVTCAACHAPLPEAPDLTLAQVEGFPEPPSHALDGFVLQHGEAPLDIESCAVCHAQESCARCHLNAESVPEIDQLGIDARIGELVSDSAGEWPRPTSHDLTGWEFVHADDVRSGSAACANCHAEPSCRTCHGGVSIESIDALPAIQEGGPAGVVVPRSQPPGHLPDFGVRHGAAVAADLPRCASCHVETQCAECHERSGGDAPPAAASTDLVPNPDAGLLQHDPPPVQVGPLPPEPRPGYHPENFVLRHGAEAFAIQTRCSNCHSTEVFCRDCHASSGFAVEVDGGAGGAFHDAQPNWFFEHGVAARQGLEACASCHQQTSCLRCHSARAGLGINPHGPSFDPGRLAARSTISCGLCHTAGQIPPP